MVLENRRASFNIENVTYKEIEKEYKRFSLKCHPDKRGDAEIFKAGGGAWRALNKTLDEDDEEGKNPLGEANLKKGIEPLLTYLKKYLKTHIEKNIETYRNKNSATPPQ